jgi:acetyltransferase
VVIYTPIAGADTEAILGAAHDIADGRVTVVGSVADGVPRHPPAGQANPVPFYPFPESAVRALAHAARAGRVRRRAADPAPPPDEARAARGRRALWTAHPGGWLAPEAVDDLLEAYGIRAARARVVRSPEEAAELQAAWGVPVAVKLVSDTLTHKSDVGGVVLGVDGPGAAASAYRAIARNVAAAGHDGAMAGALVQEQAGEGVDMLVGAVCDPVFGPLVVAGLGGVQAELWRDRSLALAPVGRAESLAMLARLRSARLLAGWRGAPPADVSALGDVITRVGRLAADQPALAELDLNPVRVMPEGHGVLVLDARVRRREARAAG